MAWQLQPMAALQCWTWPAWQSMCLLHGGTTCKKGFIMSHIAATPVQCLRRESCCCMTNNLSVAQTLESENGFLMVLGHLCLPLGSLFTKKTPWKTQLQQRYCHYGNRLLRVLFVFGCEQGWPSQLVWVSIAHPCPCFNIPGSFKDVVAFRMYLCILCILCQFQYQFVKLNPRLSERMMDWSSLVWFTSTRGPRLKAPVGAHGWGIWGMTFVGGKEMCKLVGVCVWFSCSLASVWNLLKHAQ